MRENIVVMRGDNRLLERTLHWQGEPMDVTGSTVTLTVQDLFTKDGDVVAGSGGGGEVEFAIEPADTEDAPDYRRTYHYDIQVDDGGVITTPLYGDFIVVPDVTE